MTTKRNLRAPEIDIFELRFGFNDTQKISTRAAHHSVQADLVVRSAQEPLSRRGAFSVSLVGSPAKPLSPKGDVREPLGRFMFGIRIDKPEHTFYNITVHYFHETAIDSLLKSQTGVDL